MIGNYLAALRGRRGMTLCALLALSLGWWMSATLLMAITAALVRRDALRISREWAAEAERGARHETELADWRRALMRMSRRRTGA
jgi:hypothetical protein